MQTKNHVFQNVGICMYKHGTELVRDRDVQNEHQGL